MRYGRQGRGRRRGGGRPARGASPGRGNRWNRGRVGWFDQLSGRAVRPPLQGNQPGLFRGLLGMVRDHVIGAGERTAYPERPVYSPVPWGAGERIERGTGRMKAVVDANACTGCGICEGECAAGAITMGDIALVNGALCTGCGVCVEACPNGAIVLK